MSASTVFTSVAGPSDYPLKPAPEGSLCALDRRSGALRWRMPAVVVAGAYLRGYVGAPIVAGSHLIVAGLDGTLQAFPIDDGARR